MAGKIWECAPPPFAQRWIELNHFVIPNRREAAVRNLRLNHPGAKAVSIFSLTAKLHLN
jgi:hypothetical protein